MRVRMLLSRLGVSLLTLGVSMSLAGSATAKEPRSTGPTLSWAREIWEIWSYTSLIVPVIALLVAIGLAVVLVALRSSKKAALRKAPASSVEDRVTAG